MEILAPYAKTPKRVLKKMLEYAEPKEGELLVDLGSGKGNIVMEAARKYSVNCIGVELDPFLVDYSRQIIRENGLEDRIEIKHSDLLNFNLEEADIVTAYLLPGAMKLLEGKVQKELRPTARVVSHDYEFPHKESTKYIGLFDFSPFPPWFPTLHWVHLYKMDNFIPRIPVKEKIKSGLRKLRKT